MCERELETEQNCNILTPTLLAITTFLSRSPGLLNWGPGGPASLGHVPQSSIFSPTHLISNWSDIQLPDFLSSPGLYNNLTPTLLPASVTISHSFNPSTVKAIISWYSSTGCTCYLHRCISHLDSLPRSEVNIQQQQPEFKSLMRLFAFLFMLIVLGQVWINLLSH